MRLEFDVEPDSVVSRGEHLSEGGNAFAGKWFTKESAHIKGLDLCQRSSIDADIAAADASQVGVVHDDDFLISGELHIDFRPVGLVDDGLFEGGDRVFRSGSRAGAV